MGKLRVGILGAGRIAVIMADTLYRMKGAVPYAVASRDLEKAKKFAKDNKVEVAYGSYEEMLKDPKVDLVYVATPHTMHLAHGKMCIDFGKPVLMEKPFCVNEAQAKELLDYAAEKKVFITEAIWIRYMPMYQTIKDIMESGIIGEPKLLTANLGYEMTFKERLVEPSLAGGALLDVGIYPLNVAYMFFGDDIKKVSSHAVMTDKGVDAQESITIEYNDGRLAVLHTSMLMVSDRMGVIQGTKGFMVIENINNFQSVAVYNDAYKRILYKKCPKQVTGYEYEVKSCKKALKKKELSCPEMPHAETLKLMKAMDDIRKQMNLVYPCEE